MSVTLRMVSGLDDAVVSISGVAGNAAGSSIRN
jgi:hypothetical protein